MFGLVVDDLGVTGLEDLEDDRPLELVRAVDVDDVCDRLDDDEPEDDPLDDDLPAHKIFLSYAKIERATMNKINDWKFIF